MENVLLNYINEGKITNIDELKRLYRRIVLKTHPDSIGSNQLVNKFIEFSKYYEEARALLGSNIADSPITTEERIPNHRLYFFQALQVLETLELPYTQDKQTKKTKIDTIKHETYAHFINWKGDYAELYKLADSEYDSIKKEKPRGPYMKHALYLNLRPVFHNIIAYHLSGSPLYQRQIKQNLAAIMLRLEEKQYFSLRDYLRFLIADMNNGPAVFNNE
jgi:hypothetical protein